MQPGIGRIRGFEAPGAFALLAAILLACSGSGGGSGDSSGSGSGGASQPAAAANVIELAPGQTSAQLAWEPSVGPVEGYAVFVSRNGEAWSRTTDVDVPRVTVQGRGGDEVQIFVEAIGANDTASPPSAPSPILRFRDPEPVQAARAARDEPTIGAVARSAADDTSSDPTPPEATPAAPGHDLTTRDAGGSTASPQDASEATGASPVPDLPSLTALLGADLRIPVLALSTDGWQWLARQVEARLAAGVTLAGTARRDDDGLRELVWRDAAGQLFVSDGAALRASEDPTTTFEEGIRLGATERFVGLEDFDGDGDAEWLIDDVATGDVRVVEEGTSTATRLPAPADASVFRLVGHGDLDGDGSVEILWQSETGRLFPARPDGGLPAALTSWEASLSSGPLVVADLDGDGLDDLLGRAEDDTLTVILTEKDDMGRIGTRTTPAATPDLGRRSPLATVDVDADGAAEVVWLEGEAVSWEPAIPQPH